MERPSSRGSMAFTGGGVAKAPTGSPLAVPGRPNTAQRGAVGGPAGVPGTAVPGTAGGGRLPTGAPTGRLGTAARGPAGMRPGTASLQANIQVADRPVTQQGMAGMKAGQQYQRQVMDNSYFLSQLRQRKAEIIEVTRKMQTDMARIEKDSSKFDQMEARFKKLEAEVKQARGELADYNAVLDKHQMHISIDTITKEADNIRTANAAASRRADAIASERFTIEGKTKTIQQQIDELEQKTEQRLNSMPPDVRDRYQDLQRDRRALAAEAARGDGELRELSRALGEAEMELKSNPVKERALALQDVVATLEERKFELEHQRDAARESPEAQRDKLMLRIKRDNAEVDNKSQQIKALQEAIKKMDARLRELGAGAGDDDAEEKRRKFEQLLEKERDMNDFMLGYGETEMGRKARMSELQERVLSLLGQIKKYDTFSAANLPDSAKFREMQDELEYKKTQMESAKNTQVRLDEELAMRKADLDKISMLEKKIKSELESLGEKESKMRAELGKLEDLESLKQEHSTRKERLETQKVALARRAQLLSDTVADKAASVERKVGQLDQLPAYKEQLKLESRYRMVAAKNFEMSEFIRARQADNNHESIISDITQLVSDLQTHLCK